jgi:hypothetical protein
MRCITVRIVTHLARTSVVSVIAAALRGAGLGDIFLIRETEPGVAELAHNARRESTLHVRTDLFDARRALERAGFEAFEVGCSIIARKAAALDPKPPLAKAPVADEGDDERSEASDAVASSGGGRTRVA